MRLFFFIQNHQLLKFCKDDQVYMAIFHCIFHCFFIGNTVKINHFVIYKMTTISKIKSHFEQFLSEIYTVRLCKKKKKKRKKKKKKMDPEVESKSDAELRVSE